MGYKFFLLRGYLCLKGRGKLFSIWRKRLVDYTTKKRCSNSGLNPMHNPLGHNVVLGAVNLADPGDAGTSDFNQVFSALFNSLGLTNIGMASERLDSRDVNYGRSERTAGSGVSATAQSEASLGVGRAEISPHQSAFGPQSVHYLGQQHPTVIPDSLTTLSQFLSHVRHQFDIRVTSDFFSSDHLLGDADRQHSARAEGGRTQHVGGHNDASPLIYPQSKEELAKELEDQANVTDPLARSMIQSRAVRYGTLFQNFGSLFLELGRTVMTLRMGQTPSEAVVNAGPAIFVSSTGATPLMVQAGTSFGGIPMGNQQPGGLPHGSGLLAGNINIRIHRGPSVPVAAENVSGQPTEEQPSGTADPPRTSAENLAHQVFQGLLSNASIPQESGPRVVPLRTVVAVPAGVSRPPPPDSSGGAVGLLYPLYAGFHQRIPGTLDDARISQVSLRPTAQPQTPDSITRGPSAASTPPSGQVTSPINGEQAPEGEQGSAGGVGGDGLFFSSLVRQLMPFISENASEAGGSSSSGRVSDRKLPLDCIMA
ncbi:unnamed protein product [Spirodela intermedia]|uniref:Uncharacterized protein n=1 Tax=Spirodela intermedia TaxID=51605 RepID=A0A7I8JS90_SPIIN|nr:unnamed protein product [Spirodela intermedia]CAA6672292.1 unnamed protein product [Spirodela intermedia]